jgi:hypothetical protein
MLPPVPIRADLLTQALEWSSSDVSGDNVALISRASGEVFFRTMPGEYQEALPDDIDDETAYLAVPHKNDLDLGRQLVLDFACTLPPAHSDAIESYFRQRGAYAKFKSHLERAHLLEQWYAFESAQNGKALEAWAVENGLIVVKGKREA